MESVRTRRHAIYREAIQVGIDAPLVLHRYHAQSAEAGAVDHVGHQRGSAIQGKARRVLRAAPAAMKALAGKRRRAAPSLRGWVPMALPLGAP
jgi:hypothetical protein